MALSKLLCFFVYFAGQMSDGMANSFFKFKQFTIHQERSAMRVSTDGVLLGAWSRVEKSNRILDIGTGTGLIAIMAAQRSLARIDAVELDFGAASEAAFNVSLSPWKDRITVYCMDFCRFYDKTTKPVYHHILSNPPYFIDSLLPPDGKRERELLIMKFYSRVRPIYCCPMGSYLWYLRPIYKNILFLLLRCMDSIRCGLLMFRVFWVKLLNDCCRSGVELVDHWKKMLFP